MGDAVYCGMACRTTFVNSITCARRSIGPSSSGDKSIGSGSDGGRGAPLVSVITINECRERVEFAIAAQDPDAQP